MDVGTQTKDIQSVNICYTKFLWRELVSDRVSDLWDDMGTLNSLYSEMCWKNDEPIEFIPDYENDCIIIRRKKWN